MSTLDSIDLSRAACLRRLAEHATEDAPKLFALYGVYHGEQLQIFCGWGLQWPPDAGGAILYDRSDNSTWHGESAESIHATHELFADAQLVWL